MKFKIGDFVEIIDEKFLEVFTNSKPAYGEIDSIFNGTVVPDTRFQDQQNFVNYQEKYDDKETTKYWIRIRNSDHIFNSKQIRKLTQKEINVLKVLKS